MELAMDEESTRRVLREYGLTANYRSQGKEKQWKFVSAGTKRGGLRTDLYLGSLKILEAMDEESLRRLVTTKMRGDLPGKCGMEQCLKRGNLYNRAVFATPL